MGRALARRSSSVPTRGSATTTTSVRSRDAVAAARRPTAPGSTLTGAWLSRGAAPRISTAPAATAASALVEESTTSTTTTTRPMAPAAAAPLALNVTSRRGAFTRSPLPDATATGPRPSVPPTRRLPLLPGRTPDRGRGSAPWWWRGRHGPGGDRWLAGPSPRRDGGAPLAEPPLVLPT